MERSRKKYSYEISFQPKTNSHDPRRNNGKIQFNGKSIWKYKISNNDSDRNP